MQVTPNYGLKKIELTDSPPDITVHSGNFDIIDAQLKINSNEINILKESVSSGKSVVATAITGKGVPTVATDTFQQMASNIDSIKLGSGNATVDDVLAGKTFTNSSGGELIGTMPDRGSVGTQKITTQNGQYTIPAGYHNGTGKVQASFSNLISSNIVKDTVIGGVSGSAVVGTAPSSFGLDLSTMGALPYTKTFTRPVVAVYSTSSFGISGLSHTKYINVPHSKMVHSVTSTYQTQVEDINLSGKIQFLSYFGNIYYVSFSNGNKTITITSDSNANNHPPCYYYFGY